MGSHTEHNRVGALTVSAFPSLHSTFKPLKVTSDEQLQAFSEMVQCREEEGEEAKAQLQSGE